MVAQYTHILPKASDKFIQYYEEAEGNKIAKFNKACEKFRQNHKLAPPYINYRSFASIYRYVR